MIVGVGGDERELGVHVFTAHCAKKADAFRITSFSSFNRLEHFPINLARILLR